MTSFRRLAVAVVLLTTLAFVAMPFQRAMASDPVAPEYESPRGEYLLEGTLTDAETGEPVPDARVHAWTEPRAEGGEPSKDHALTDANGTFTLHLNAGHVMLGAHADGYQDFRDEFTLEGNATRAIALQPIPPPDATLSGRVTDEAGNPIQGAHVSLSSMRYHAIEPMEAEEPAGSSNASSGSTSIARPMPAHDYRYEWQDTRTDADGRFSFDVYSGMKAVSVHTKGYAGERREFDVKPGENEMSAIKLEKMPEQDAVLQGQVVDAETGLPVANAWVNVQSFEWSHWRSARTDADGTFSIQTFPGYARIDVHVEHGDEREVVMHNAAEGTAVPVPDADPPRREYYAWAGTTTLASGENPLTVSVQPKPLATHALVGYVLDAETEKGLAGAWVNVRNLDTGEWGHARTDEHGSYKFLVRPGRLIVEANAPDHFNGVERVHVKDEDVQKRVDLRLPEGQQRHGGCYDCYEIAYTEAAVSEGMSHEEARTPPPPTKGGAPTMSRGDAMAMGAGMERGPDEGSTYSGGGGGLGPYTAESADSEPVGESDAPRNTPVGALPVLVLGALGAALATRSRRPRA